MDTVNICCCNCKKTVTPPIKQCAEKHTVCGKCITKLSDCPKCSTGLYTISYNELENILAQVNETKLNLPACKYESEGCTYRLSKNKLASHEAECRFRKFHCEGAKFCRWDCKWTGNYDQILSHFRHFHDSSGMKHKMEGALKMDLDVDSFSLEPIDYYDGQSLFWYKQKIDVTKQMVYFLFQYVGLSKDAHQYYYEFDIVDGPTRKVKVMEFCVGDCVNANSIFESGKCISLPFTTIKSFLNSEGYLVFRYRIVKVKKTTNSVSIDEEPVSAKNPVLYRS